MTSLFPLWLVASLLATGCYGSAHQLRAQAEAAWTQGQKPEAIALGHQMYARYVNANRDASLRVPAATALIRTRLAEELVIPANTPPRTPPGVDSERPHEPSPQRDLLDAVLSLDAGRALPAIQNLRNLGLTRLAATLFVVLDRPEPFTDSSRLTRGLDTATLSLVVKAFALEALEHLAEPPTP